MFNSNNKSHAVINIGALAATKEFGFIHAHKKMIVRNLSMVDIVAVGADEVNYVEMEALINGVDSGAVKSDTKLGLAARAPLSIGALPKLETGAATNLGIVLEKGEVLSVVLTKQGTGALTNATLHADVEIVGNGD